MNSSQILLRIFIMFLVTYLPRILPVTLFRRNIRSRFIQSFLGYTPYAVLGAMTFPDIIYSTGSIVSALAGTVVALILAYLRRSLVEVAIAAIVAVYVVQLF